MINNFLNFEVSKISNINKVKELYKSLSQRKRPEDMAELVLSILEKDLSHSEVNILKKASKGSLKNRLFGYTSMLQDFYGVSSAEKQIKKTIELFELEYSNTIEYSNIDDVADFIKEVSLLINKSVGQNNFEKDRLNKKERKELNLEISKRQYNKKWRLLKRLEKKLFIIKREVKKLEFQKISKHGIVHHLDYESFSADINSACFIAYYNSRCNLRSVFTNKAQDKPYDEISDMLFNRIKSSSIKGEKKWLAISYIYSSQKVLSNLTDEQKGFLLGKWTNVIKEIADLLEEIWNKTTIQRKTMIVQKGNDSTTWNNTAGAWNKSRDNWINLVYSLGLEYLLDEICFGKVMRLMAADVAYWHANTGGKLDPNTEVWNNLPLPWEVLSGKKKCNKDLVIKYCKEAGIDAVKSGWIAPRLHGITKFKPTPELVHGVEISNPFLARVLKKHKYFSGKNVKPFFPEI